MTVAMSGRLRRLAGWQPLETDLEYMALVCVMVAGFVWVVTR